MLSLVMFGALSVAANAASANEAQEWVVARNAAFAEGGFEPIVESVMLSPEEALLLWTDPSVMIVEPNEDIEAADITTNQQRVGLDHVPGLAINAAEDVAVDATIAIIDGGVLATHPDLNVTRTVDCTADPCVVGSVVATDHGTHVASIAAARDNGVGIVGTAPGARIWSLQVTDANGVGSVRSLASAMQYLLENPGDVSVANMSLGCECDSNILNFFTNELVNDGIALVAAAGNSSMSANTQSPARFDQVISVSAITDSDGVGGGSGGTRCQLPDDEIAFFSNFDADITAPGVCIEGAAANGGYTVLTGTSMAAPHVAGALALLQSNDRATSAADVQSHTNRLLAAGTFDWVDTTDGVEEPALDVSTFTPRVISTDSSVGGVTPGNTTDAQPSPASPTNPATPSTTPTCNGLTVTVNLALGEQPTEGNDVILGTDANDVIDALAGNDTVCGGAGSDTIRGGQGSDTLVGGRGHDVLRGGKGSDTLIGNRGRDHLSGDNNADILSGGRGNDYLDGGLGSDEVRGGAGTNTCATADASSDSTTGCDIED